MGLTIDEAVEQGLISADEATPALRKLYVDDQLPGKQYDQDEGDTWDQFEDGEFEDGEL